MREGGTMELTLPFPPSVNHYYRRVGPRTLISREGRTFRRNVCALLGGGGPRKPPSGGRIALAMDAFPPDDIFNLTVMPVVQPADTTYAMRLDWKAASDPVSGLRLHYIYRQIEGQNYTLIDSVYSDSHYVDVSVGSRVNTALYPSYNLARGCIILLNLKVKTSSRYCQISSCTEG